MSEPSIASFDPHLALAVERLKAGEFDGALGCLIEEEAGGEDFRRLLVIALAQLELGRLAVAESKALEAGRCAPDAPLPLLLLARVHAERGDDAGAGELCERALALDPAHLVALAMLGISRRGQGRWPEAREAFRKLARLAPQAEFAQMLVADMELRCGDAEAARRRCVAALSMSQTALARMALGDLLGARGRIDEAAREYRVAAESWTTTAVPLVRLGELFERAGRIDEALGVHAEALKRDPRAGFAQLSRGRCELLRGRAEEACAAFEAASELMPLEPEAHLGLFRAHSLLGRADRADEALAAARRLEESASSERS